MAGVTHKKWEETVAQNTLTGDRSRGADATGDTTEQRRATRSALPLAAIVENSPELVAISYERR